MLTTFTQHHPFDLCTHSLTTFMIAKGAIHTQHHPFDLCTHSLTVFMIAIHLVFLQKVGKDVPLSTPPPKPSSEKSLSWSVYLQKQHFKKGLARYGEQQQREEEDFEVRHI